MQGNIQNNWTGLLENAEHFPAETFNKNETWEKLYRRLHNKPQYKIAKWYWMAAACLLITAAIFLLMNKQEQQPSFATNPSHNKKSETGIAKETILSNENNEQLVSTSTEDKKNIAPTLHNNNIKVVKMETVSDRILDSVNNTALIKTAMAPIIHFDSAMATTPAKKKLRVVHVNEIDQPAEESMANQFIQKHGFEFRIINNEIYNPSNVPVSNGLILFKSRNTSN